MGSAFSEFSALAHKKYRGYKPPLVLYSYGGRGGFRTHDFYRVKVALSR
jgi:hypothetical protein